MQDLKNILLLLCAAMIFGAGFIGQSIGMQYISPYAFTFFRSFLGGLVLLPIIYYNSKLGHAPSSPKNRKTIPLGIFFCGLFLFLGETFQQIGLVTTDAGRAGFITSAYMIIVPIISLFFGVYVGFKLWIAVVISLTGMYLLCIKEGFYLSSGDFFVFLCAIAFAIHVHVIAYYVKYINGIVLSCGQFFVASFLGFIVMIFTGGVNYDDLVKAIPAILWVGIMSNGVAYTCQTLGQKNLNQNIVGLILSLEALFATLFGCLILDERMTQKESLGCALILAGALLAQWRFKKRKNKATN